ncbi:MAG: hypothetical protein JXQ72_15445 [Anaerolineae bacterium]|nr:hypothetical protein [Anaerolineae bacterium]
MARKDTFMAKYPNAKMIGAGMLSIFEAMGETAKPYLVKHGLDPLEAEKRYALQQYIDTLYDILENEPNVMSNMVGIGIYIVDTAHLPPDMDTLEKALNSLEVIWQMHTQNAGQNWDCNKVDDSTFLVTNQGPIPPDVEYGVVYGFVRKFAGHRSFTVEYEDINMRNGDTQLITFIVSLK